jgi:hypothetical protein
LRRERMLRRTSRNCEWGAVPLGMCLSEREPLPLVGFLVGCLVDILVAGGEIGRGGEEEAKKDGWTGFMLRARHKRHGSGRHQRDG